MGFDLTEFFPKQHSFWLVFKFQIFARVRVNAKMSFVFVEILQPVLQERTVRHRNLFDTLRVVGSQHLVTTKPQPCLTIQFGCDGRLKGTLVVAA